MGFISEEIVDYARQSIYAEVDVAMFRRKTVLTQGLCEEKSVYDSFNKLIAAQIRGKTIIMQKLIVNE